MCLLFSINPHQPLNPFRRRVCAFPRSQFPSAKPGTLLRSAFCPSLRQRPLCYIHFPSQQAFVLVTLKGRAVFQHPADTICKDMRAFLWVPRYEVIVLAAHLAGLSRQSKFNGAAATAGAATCAEGTLNTLVNLCRAGFHSTGFGSPACQTNGDPLFLNPTTAQS